MLVSQGFGVADNQMQGIDLPSQLSSTQSPQKNSNENVSTTPPKRFNNSSIDEDLFIQEQFRQLENSKSPNTNGVVDPVSLTYSKPSSNDQSPSSTVPTTQSPAIPIKKYYKENGKQIK